MKTPKVSIIVPVYGVERYIERCAVSLFEQTYPNIEYVFVNDATPDNAVAVLEQVIARYPNRKSDVRLVNHPQNRGISATRNTGLKAVTGDFILYVDSDDYLAQYAIEHLVNKSVETDADIVLFDTNVITQKGVCHERVEYEGKEQYIKRLLQHTAKCAHWNKFYKSAFYLSIGILADESIRLADDYAVTPRIVHNARKIAVLHEPLYFYETTNQSSYVHNLTRAAIESQFAADSILISYFSNVPDAADYADVVEAIPQRTMVSLVKKSSTDTWPDILDVYRQCRTQKTAKGMTMVNKVIFRLIQRNRLVSLKLFLRFYHFVMHDNY